MMRLVRAEWRKTLTTRLVWGMLAGYVLYTVANAVANGVFAGQQGTPGLDTAQGMRTVFASAAVFAVVHPPISMLPVFVLGVATALSFERTRLLLVPMIVHAVYNAGILFL